MPYQNSQLLRVTGNFEWEMSSQIFSSYKMRFTSYIKSLFGGEGIWRVHSLPDRDWASIHYSTAFSRNTPGSGLHSKNVQDSCISNTLTTSKRKYSKFGIILVKTNKSYFCSNKCVKFIFYNWRKRKWGN